MPFKATNALQGTFIADCRMLNDVEIVEKWVHRVVPYAFRRVASDFDKWRSGLAACLGVQPESVFVVGSTAAGLSLSPYKGLRMRSNRSDIDVAIVSAAHFEIAWTWLLAQRTQRVGYPAAVNGWIMEHQKHIFFRQIACDQYLEYLPFGREWLACLDKAARQPPAGERPVKLRIYADKQALTNYIAHGVGKLRANLGI